MRIRVGNTLLRYGSTRLALGTGTAPTYATTFSLALSASSGAAGSTQAATVTPIGGAWPSGQPIALSVSGVACSVSPDSRTGSGATPATFSFTPSAAGALSVNAIAAGMTSTGAQSYTVTATPSVPAPSSIATRIDVVFDQSAVAPGGTVTGSIVPNGLWPTTTGRTATLTPGSGSAVVVNLPSTGSAAATFSFAAPSAGIVTFTPTNTAGLLNPWPPQVNVFAGSSGTARTLAASLAGTLPDLRSFQRDTVSGNPTGFSFSWAKGWGSVAINVTTLSGATDGIWIKLYDGRSSGASTTVGSGTALHSAPVQVHGALGGTGSIAPLLPAGPYLYFADIATDAAFTSPVRIAQRFSVGVTVMTVSRSQETGFAQYYADNTAFTAIYPKLAVWTSGDPRYAADAYTGIHWGLSADTSAGQELARILEAQLGVVVGITGVSTTGGGLDAYFAHDGTPSSAIQGTVSASCGGKFRYATISMGGWDGSDSNYPSETYAEDQVRMVGAVAKLPQLYPGLAVTRWCSGASGWFGSDGSRDLGYTRINGIARALEVAYPHVVSGESTLWNEFANSHATQAARLDYARTAARILLATEPAAMGGLGTPNRGPTLGSTGTVSGRTLKIPYTLHGGSTLTSVKALYSNPNATYGTASAAELAPLWSVYAGTGGRQGAGLAIKIASATINASSSTVDLVLSGSSGVTYSDNSTGAMPSSFTAHYAADFGASASRLPDGTGSSLCDDVTEYSIPYGRLMRPALDIAVS